MDLNYVNTSDKAKLHYTNYNTKKMGKNISEQENNVSTNAEKPENNSHNERITAEPADFETAVSATKFGKFNILLFAIAIPSGWATKFDTTTMSYILPVAQCDLDLSLDDKGVLNGITYAGMITSAFLWGYLVDTLGRRKLLVFGYLLDGVFSLLAGLSQNYQMLLFSKYMTGLSINGPHAAHMTYLSEFHCAKHRARVLLALGMVFSFGNMALPLLAWLILPLNINVSWFHGNFVLHSWNVYLLLCALPSIISGFAYIWLPESPKFLMTVGKNKQALKIFENMYCLNTGKPKQTYPIQNLIDETKLRGGGDLPQKGHVTANRTKKQALKEGWQQIIPLFFPPNLAYILLVCVLQFGLMNGFNTLRLWLPQIFAAIEDYHIMYPNNVNAGLCEMLSMINPNKTMNNETVTCSASYANYGVYLKNITVAAATIFAFTIAGLVINALGKKRILLILTIMAGCCAISLYFPRDTLTITILSSAYIALSGITPNVIVSIVVDLFPTSLRTMSVSLTMMCGRIGAMIGNLTFPLLLNAGCLPPFLTIGSLSLGSFFLILFLPKTDLSALR